MAPTYALKTHLYVVSKVYQLAHEVLTRAQAIHSVIGDDRRATANADFDAFINVRYEILILFAL